MSKKQDDTDETDDTIDEGTDERPAAEDVELEVEDEPAAKADASDDEDDEDPQLDRKAKRAKRQAEHTSLLERARLAEERASLLERHLQQSAQQQGGAQRQAEPDDVSKRIADIEEEVDTLRVAASVQNLPGERRARLEARYKRLNEEYTALAVRRHMPAQQQQQGQPARMAEDVYLEAQFPDIYASDQAKAEARAEFGRLMSSGQQAATPLATAIKAAQNVLRRMGKAPAGATSASDASAQAKMGGTGARGSGGAVKKTVKVPAAYVEVAMKTFPKAKTPMEAVKQWKAHITKTKPSLAKELGF